MSDTKAEKEFIKDLATTLAKDGEEKMRKVRRSLSPHITVGEIEI